MESNISLERIIIEIQEQLINNLDKDICSEVVNKYIENKLSIEGLEFYLNVTCEFTVDEMKKTINRISELVKNESIKVKQNENNMISIVIPIYNAGELIVDTINSILMQSYHNFEILLIDDCSTDNTEEIIAEKFITHKNIKYIKNKENLDVGRTRLKGFMLSKGDYVIFMDQDDFYLDQNFFLKSINIFSKYKDISFIACDTFIYRQDIKKIILHELNLPFNIDKENYFYNLQSKGYPKPTSTFPVIYKKSNLEKLKLNEVKYIGDSTVYQRALLLGQPYILDNVVGVYRIHESNSTKSINANFVIETLDSQRLTKDLAIKEYNYDIKSMEDWFNKRANISFAWFLNTRHISLENALTLLQYANENNIRLIDSVKERLLSAIE